MQLTRFDRWLRETFVHETHIYSLRPPEILPTGIRAEELPDRPGLKFKHRYITRNQKAAESLIAVFKEHNQMFTTRVVDRKGWHVKFVAPEGKSVFWWIVWVIISLIAVATVGQALRTLWHNPTFQENFMDAIEVLKG